MVDPLWVALGAAVSTGGMIVGGAWLWGDKSSTSNSDSITTAETSSKSLTKLTTSDHPIQYNQHLNKFFVALHNILIEAYDLHHQYQPESCAALLEGLRTTQIQLNKLAAWGEVTTKNGMNHLQLTDADIFLKDLNELTLTLETNLRERVVAIQNPSLDIKFLRIYKPLTNFITSMGNNTFKNIMVHARRNIINNKI